MTYYINVNSVGALAGNTDFAGTNTYVVATVVRKDKRGDVFCFSGAKSRITTSTSSEMRWDDKLQIASTCKEKLVFNVMSTSIFGTFFVGQTSLDFHEHSKITNGNDHKFKLELGPALLPVYDAKGNLVQPAGTKSQVTSGTLEIDVTVPSVYSNMCGWFWNVTESWMEISGEKIFVNFEDNVLVAWDSPFHNRVVCKVDCKKVKSLSEKTFEKLAGGITMYGVGIAHEGGPDLYWAWGDDAKSIKGEAHVLAYLLSCLLTYFVHTYICISYFMLMSSNFHIAGLWKRAFQQNNLTASTKGSH